MASTQQIVEKKRRKYGTHCFEKWGREGGSPILKAYARGKVIIKK